MMGTQSFYLLYVDDDENDIRLLQLASQSAGLSHCLHTVSSGPLAIDYFQGHGPYADRVNFPLPQVVLLDLRMPRMNGLEVLRWLRSQVELRGVVVIVFTASAHPDDVSRACELGANAFVQKPSTQTELISFLKAIKAFWGSFHVFPSSKASALLGDLSSPNLTP